MPKKILVVDDEAHIVEMMSMRLEAAGYTVISAFDGEDALEKARAEFPDLILLDLMLPKLDGYQVCRLLKSDHAYNRIPIIMLTARAQDDDVKLGRETGADEYLTKPFDPKDLMARIGELLK